MWILLQRERAVYSRAHSPDTSMLTYARRMRATVRSIRNILTRAAVRKFPILMQKPPVDQRDARWLVDLEHLQSVVPDGEVAAILGRLEDVHGVRD